MAICKECIQLLEKVYDGRTVFYGDMHNHSNSGGTSDGQYTLCQWREDMGKLGMDFVAILDHKQVRHMYLPEWDNGIFIGGTEPGTVISDSGAEKKDIHYNMIFAEPEPLMELLEKFSEYSFEGGGEGHFVYPEFTVERMRELVKTVRDKGGFFVHPHPKLCMQSENPLDYWFADETGIEVMYYGSHETDDETREEMNRKQYELWCDLLKAGKRVWACAGEDGHANPTVEALTTVYASARNSKAYIECFRNGDFVCGNVGIRMCIGETSMGGICDFSEKNLVVCVSDFHKSAVKEGHEYILEIIDDCGVTAREKLSVDEKNYFCLKAENAKFYRTEVIDVTENRRIAIGNPVWNSNKI